MGTVVVTAQPAGAKVQLDNSTPILVPATFKDLVPGTTHELVIFSPGYEKKKIPIKVAAGDSNYDLNLIPLVTHVKHPKATGATPQKHEGGGSLDTNQPLDPWSK
jgi:hypothetical protein